MDLVRVIITFINDFLVTKHNYLPLTVMFAELLPLSFATEQLYWPAIEPLTVRML